MNWFQSAKSLLKRWKSPKNDFWERFTPRGLIVLSNAREEAERLHHNYIGTEHLLFGLIKMEKGVAANVLKNLGFTLGSVHAEIEKWDGLGMDQMMFGNIPLTPRTKRVLEMAKEEGKVLGHTYVGTEHLLLGLLKESDGLAAQIFKKYNVDMEQLRKAVVEELNPKQV